MLPGPRIVLAAIAATLVIVVLGFAQLVKFQVAQSRSASFGPVEARFAGLAFAERADWTPVATSSGRSLEALAPFGNLSVIQPRRPDREAAGAPLPIQTAALEHPVPVSDAPPIKLAPVTVAKIDAAAHADIPIATPQPVSAEEHPSQNPFRRPSAPKSAENRATPGGALAGKALIHIAALPPPADTLTPAVPAQGSVEVLVAAMHAPIEPVPAALSEAGPAAVASPAALALPEPPRQVAALPDDVQGDDAGADAGATGTRAGAQTVGAPLPSPRPGLASLLLGEVVPVPTPRPNITFPAQRRIVRRRTAARPVQPRPLNPFAALFGAR